MRSTCGKSGGSERADAAAQVAAVYLAGLGLIRTVVGPPPALEKRDCAAVVADLLPTLIEKARAALPHAHPLVCRACIMQPSRARQLGGALTGGQISPSCQATRHLHA